MEGEVVFSSGATKGVNKYEMDQLYDMKALGRPLPDWSMQISQRHMFVWEARIVPAASLPPSIPGNETTPATGADETKVKREKKTQSLSSRLKRVLGGGGSSNEGKFYVMGPDSRIIEVVITSRPGVVPMWGTWESIN